LSKRVPKPFLSIVIPAYNEEDRLPHALEQVFAFLQVQAYDSEVLVVENGSRDRTLEIAQAFARSNPALKVMHNDARGKGLAVQRGMLEAQGEYRFMCDADFSMPVSEINNFLPPVLDHYDIAIASREAPGAVRYNEPPYRHFVGRGYNLLIRLLALPGLQDTQCGFKCFRGEAAEKLFRRQTLTGLSFDVEILYIARRLGLRSIEVPIPWYYDADTRVNVLKDSLRMGVDLLTIRWNGWRGVYEG
jgi:glycosyltransferase involved in cell wall biosynthesis